MIIKTFVEGPFDANNYLLIDEKSSESVLIDCSSSCDDFIQNVKNAGAKLKYVLLTHGHFDHIIGCDKFREVFGCKIYVNKEDVNQPNSSMKMANEFMGLGLKEIAPITDFVNDGDEFIVGNICIKAIATPGHTQGGMSYLVDGKLFSGDTLFKGSVGRTDLPGGNWKELLHSVRDKLFLFPDETEIYPGHGPKSTIGYEKEYNEIINI